MGRTPMKKAPDPDLGTELIPKERYTSVEFMRLEQERMWKRVGLLAGRESDIRTPGDYFTFELGSEYSLRVIPGGDVLDEDMYNLPRVQAGMS